MKKILVAVDYSATAEVVAKAGHELAKAMEAETILLHVVTDPIYYSSLKYSPIFGFDNFSNINLIETDTDEQLLTASYKYLGSLKHLLGDQAVQTVVKSGECGETILGAVSELDADVLVMGTHSRQGFEKMLLGSIAEKVLRNSVKPLFIVPVKTIEGNG
jgi:nucleotide-binding universal stress UspA family protein